MTAPAGLRVSDLETPAIVIDLEIMERKPETGVKILFSLAKVLGRRLNETTEMITSLTKEKKAS